MNSHPSLAARFCFAGRAAFLVPRVKAINGDHGQDNIRHIEAPGSPRRDAASIQPAADQCVGFSERRIEQQGHREVSNGLAGESTGDAGSAE